MPKLSAVMWKSLFLGTIAVCWATVFAAENADISASSVPVRCAGMTDTPKALYPAIASGCGAQLKYVGAYFADGRYRTGGMASTWAQDFANVRLGRLPSSRPSDVPPSINLHPREQLAENLAPGSDGRKTAHGRSRFAEWRDVVVTAVYGHEQALMEPQFVTTDAKGRVIVSDPVAEAVHVLDRVQPFRIVTGPQYRLHKPGPVASDADNNIFVSDTEIGVIVEFDADGRFVREIGRVGENEGMFYDIAGLVTNSKNHLLVVDSGREMLMELDRDGKVVRKAGGRRQEMGVKFHHPIAIAAEAGKIVVLDSNGENIQVFDEDCNLLRSFATGMSGTQMSLDLDSGGNIYLSSARSPRVRVYDMNGESRGEFGRFGEGRGEMASASGMWIDSADRMYVVDAPNRRVAVFQISLTTTKATP